MTRRLPMAFFTSNTLRPLLLFPMLFVFHSSHAALPDAATILSDMVERYGGAEALDKLNGPYKQFWDLVALTSNEKGTDQRTIDLPNKLIVELTYPSKSEKRILDGDSGEKIYNKARHITVKGPGLMAMKLQRMRLYNPLLLQNIANKITTAEGEDGHYKLTLHEEALTTTYYVNRKTLLIDKVTGTLEMNGNAMTFMTEYHDYKSVEGVMLPHKEVKYVGTINTAVLTLQKTQFGG